jgi:alginate O-acetyltransferase complex protein AlgI
MVFSSAAFLFLFLPVVFVLYRLLPGIRAKNTLLTVASLVFYAFGSLRLLPLLVLSAFGNYLAGRLVMTGRPHRKAVVTVAVVANLLVLAVFKYLDFFITNLNLLPGVHLPLTGITLPVGISFYTFQGMSYLLDVYRDPGQGSRSFGKVLLYIAFFPQLVAGPIVKYDDVARQIDDRACTPADTAHGLVRFIRGLTKKLLVANTLGAAADAVFGLTAGQLDARLAWLGAVCYTLQIYFDFSGYSDMAIGLGRVFGFRFRENFDHPYAAGSIQNFWRRWHISLSSWFRDYLYIPLGGNRKGKARAYRNRLLVFFCTGLWHGANWTFVLWGLWHGGLLLLEDAVVPQEKRGGAVGHVYTMLAVLLGFVLFRADTVGQAGQLFRAMFTGFSGTAETAALFWNLWSPKLLVTLVLALVFALPVRQWASARCGQRCRAVVQAAVWPVALGLLVLDMLALASSAFNPFIYFQF